MNSLGAERKAAINGAITLGEVFSLGCEWDIMDGVLADAIDESQATGDTRRAAAMSPVHGWSAQYRAPRSGGWTSLAAIG